MVIPTGPDQKGRRKNLKGERLKKVGCRKLGGGGDGYGSRESSEQPETLESRKPRRKNKGGGLRPWIHQVIGLFGGKVVSEWRFRKVTHQRRGFGPGGVGKERGV